MSSEGWKKVQLGDILTLHYGKALVSHDRNPGFIPVYSSSGITGWHDKPLVNDKGIIIGRKGNVGSIYYSDTPFYCIDTAYYVTPDDTDVDFMFLYYLLQTLGLNGLNEDSAVPGLNRETALAQWVNIPVEKQIQNLIANQIAAFDEKIKLNRQTNSTLEAIAQAVFKEWFVDFRYPGATGEMVDSELGPIPRGWRVGILSEVLSSIESGSRPKGGVGDLAEGIPSIGAENINGLGFYDFSKEKFVSEEFFAKLKSGIVKSEDVLLYKDGASLGRKTMFMDGFPHQICAINEHVFILRSNNLINQLFLYFWLDQSYMTENIKSLNSNSAQPGINQPAVRSLPILIPEKTISEKFEQIVKPLLSKLFNDCKESYSLSLLRDKLLPKLMSGEIQI